MLKKNIKKHKLLKKIKLLKSNLLTNLPPSFWDKEKIILDELKEILFDFESYKLTREKIKPKRKEKRSLNQYDYKGDSVKFLYLYVTLKEDITLRDLADFFLEKIKQINTKQFKEAISKIQ